MARAVLLVRLFGCALARERCCDNSCRAWLSPCLFWVGLRIVYARAVICGDRFAGKFVGVLCCAVCRFLFVGVFVCLMVGA